MKLISTTALAKERELEPKSLFSQLKEKGWIYKKEDQWHLTKEGRLAGGDIQYNPKFGDYIVWPSTINFDIKIEAKNNLNATAIGEHFSITSQKVNLYLAELGWHEKDKGGWVVTKEGKKHGGHQLEAMNGKPYCVWEKSILTNQFFSRSVGIGQGTYIEKEVKPEELDDFRRTHPATMRTSDGHYVRSRAELLIDNFLYNNGIVHAYEKKVNIDEPMFSDFYIPKGKVYIEFWGLEEDTKYEARKKVKLELYAKHGFNLIEIKNSDIDNIDEVLSAKLRKYDIIVD